MVGSQWLEHLPRVVLGLQTPPREDSAVSSAELVLGVPLVLAISSSIQKADFVYMKKGGVVIPQAPLYQGPFQVIIKSKKFFKVQLEEKMEGKIEAVPVCRLKPHQDSAPSLQPPYLAMVGPEGHSIICFFSLGFVGYLQTLNWVWGRVGM